MADLAAISQFTLVKANGRCTNTALCLENVNVPAIEATCKEGRNESFPPGRRAVANGFDQLKTIVLFNATLVE